MLTVHDYTFEVTSAGWPPHAQPTVDRIMVAMALEILHFDRVLARRLHTNAKVRAAMEKAATSKAREAVAKLPKPKPSLPSPDLKPGHRPPNRPKPPARGVEPVIRVFAR